MNVESPRTTYERATREYDEEFKTAHSTASTAKAA